MTISHQRALTYLSNTFDSIPNVDELLQLVEIEFIRRDAVENSANSELPSYSHGVMTFIGILRFSFFEKFVGTFGTVSVSMSIRKSESTLLIIRNV
jgi:hypothetical protein